MNQIQQNDLDESKESMVMSLLDMGFLYDDIIKNMVSSNWNFDIALSNLSTSSDDLTSYQSHSNIIPTTIAPSIIRPSPTMCTPLEERDDVLLSYQNHNFLDGNLIYDEAFDENEYLINRTAYPQPDFKPHHHLYHSRMKEPHPPHPPFLYVMFNFCNMILPLLFIISIPLLIYGILLYKWHTSNYAECGTILNTAKFTITKINDDTRVLKGNSCPGYDWTGQTTPAVAGDQSFEVWNTTVIYNFESYPYIAIIPCLYCLDFMLFIGQMVVSDYYSIED
jgi:hypothetical protein